MMMVERGKEGRLQEKVHLVRSVASRQPGELGVIILPEQEPIR